MKKSEDLAKKIIVLMYVLGLLGMLGIVIAVHITRQYEEQEAAGYTNISDGWTLDAGQGGNRANRLRFTWQAYG